MRSVRLTRLLKTVCLAISLRREVTFVGKNPMDLEVFKEERHKKGHA